MGQKSSRLGHPNILLGKGYCSGRSRFNGPVIKSMHTPQSLIDRAPCTPPLQHGIPPCGNLSLADSVPVQSVCFQKGKIFQQVRPVSLPGFLRPRSASDCSYVAQILIGWTHQLHLGIAQKRNIGALNALNATCRIGKEKFHVMYPTKIISLPWLSFQGGSSNWMPTYPYTSFGPYPTLSLRVTMSYL